MQDRVVNTDWLSANLGNPRVRIIAAAPHARAFSIGQVPGATRLDCSELLDAARGDLIDSAGFSALMSGLGVHQGDSIVLYGDPDSSAAAMAAWVFALFDHPDANVLDGGRFAWIADDRETEFGFVTPTPTDYPTIPRNDAPHRISRDELKDLIGTVTLVDTRSELAYSGAIEHSAEEAGRTGHIPSAINIPSSTLRDGSGRFRDRDTLKLQLLEVPTDQPVIVYDQTAMHAAETWLVLRFLLGYTNVRVYDGGWNEWGNSFGLPAVQGPRT